MADKLNYAASKEEIERGYKDGMYVPDKQQLDEDPHNSMWKDWDDGGFLGRPKGGE